MKKQEFSGQVESYYTELARFLGEYEKQACEEVMEYERAKAGELVIRLGSTMVPVGLAMITLARLLRKPKFYPLFSLQADFTVSPKIRALEKFLISLPGATLPECPEPVDKWLGKKRFSEKTKKEERIKK